MYEEVVSLISENKRNAFSLHLYFTQKVLFTVKNQNMLDLYTRRTNVSTKV